MLSKLTVSPAPHISGGKSTRSIMLDVIISLAPAMVAAWIFFRFRAVLVTACCVAGCVFFEWVCNKIRRKGETIDDLSAVVTGVILAFSLPPAIPLWVCFIGSAFAIVIGKVVFGGLGCNIFNPAMASRAFLTACFGMLMTTWTVPATIDKSMPVVAESSAASSEKMEYPELEQGEAVTGATSEVWQEDDQDAVDAADADEEVSALTRATPLAWSKRVIKGEADADELKPMLRQAFFGGVGGCIGETSALALLTGGAYLLIRRTITFHIPLAVIAGAFIFAEAAHLVAPSTYVPASMHIFGGSMLLCAFFIATDPVTAPMTVRGMWIFGLGVGVLIMLIRIVGEYPEGVMYSVLVMNSVSPLIDRFCRVRPVGGVPDAK